MQAISLTRGLYRNNVYCDFLVPNYSDHSLLKKSSEEGLTVYRVLRGHFFPLSLLCFLFFRRKKYNIVHFHGTYTLHFLCIWLAKMFGMKVVQKLTKGNSESHEMNMGGRLAFIRQYVYRKINTFVAISSALERGLHKEGIPREKVFFIPNGVDVNFFRSFKTRDKLVLRRKYSLNEDDFILLFVGVILKRKNIVALLNIFSRLIIDSNEDEKLKLVLVGPVYDRDYYRHLQKIIKKMNIQDRVMVLCNVEHNEINELYCIADIMVFAGCDEGMPNVLLEAKSSELPVVAFHSHGVEDVVRNGIDGFLVQPDNIEHFSSKLKELYNNRELLKSFSKEAREDCLRRFAMDRIADQYISNVYSLKKDTKDV